MNLRVRSVTGCSRSAMFACVRDLSIRKSAYEYIETDVEGLMVEEVAVVEEKASVEVLCLIKRTHKSFFVRAKNPSRSLKEPDN